MLNPHQQSSFVTSNMHLAMRCTQSAQVVVGKQQNLKYLCSSLCFCISAPLLTNFLLGFLCSERRLSFRSWFLSSTFSCCPRFSSCLQQHMEQPSTTALSNKMSSILNYSMLLGAHRNCSWAQKSEHFVLTRFWGITSSIQVKGKTWDSGEWLKFLWFKKLKLPIKANVLTIVTAVFHPSVPVHSQGWIWLHKIAKHCQLKLKSMEAQLWINTVQNASPVLNWACSF